MREPKGLKSFRAQSWLVSDPAKPRMHECPLGGQWYGAEPAEVKSSMLLQGWGSFHTAGGSYPDRSWTSRVSEERLR